MIVMTEHLQSVTNEQGERVAVLLDIASYHKLAKQPALDPEHLIDLSQLELEALAKSRLAPAAQQRLDELLEHKAKTQLTPEESAELDHLLEQADLLTILKTRARYTLHQLETTTA